MAPEQSFIGWRATVDEMGDDNHAKALAQAALEGDTFSWEVKREQIVEGRTFSRLALDALAAGLVSFIEARIMARWDQTGEPPSIMHVKLEVRVQ